MVWYYDAEQDLLYWATGNPCGDMNGDRRPGDNQYTNSVMALRPRTGEMARYFQFTPHDTHDWDAREPLLLDGRGFRGRPASCSHQRILLGEPFDYQTPAHASTSEPENPGQVRRE